MVGNKDESGQNGNPDNMLPILFAKKTDQRK
jgi:hypothetical protein